MSDGAPGPGWWQVPDGTWYPPELHPDYHPPGPVPDEADESARHHRRLFGILSVLILAIAVVLGVVIVSRGDDKDGQAAEPSEDDPARSRESRTATSTVRTTTTLLPKNEIGIERSSGGVFVTVLEARSAPTVSLNQSPYETGSGFETYTDVAAGPGARFVLVKVLVRNETNGSMDLTCSYPIENKLLDVDGREYDAIESLYEYPSNPACNAQLNPGFSAEMTYIYRIPDNVAVLGWGFAEVNFDSPSAPDPAAFQLIVE